MELMSPTTSDRRPGAARTPSGDTSLARLRGSNGSRCRFLQLQQTFQARQDQVRPAHDMVVPVPVSALGCELHAATQHDHGMEPVTAGGLVGVRKMGAAHTEGVEGLVHAPAAEEVPEIALLQRQDIRPESLEECDLPLPSVAAPEAEVVVAAKQRVERDDSDRGHGSERYRSPTAPECGFLLVAGTRPLGYGAVGRDVVALQEAPSSASRPRNTPRCSSRSCEVGERR